MPTVDDIVHDGVLYARSVFRAILWGTPLHVPTLLDEQQKLELDHLAERMALAMDRQLKLRWDTKTYHDVVHTQDGGDENAEARFREQFRTLKRPELEILPLTIWDDTKRGELWYIPGAISVQREMLIRDLVGELNVVLSRHGPRSGKGSWRDSEEYFRDPEFCKEFAAGVLNLALAWQMQGHENFHAGIYPSKDYATKGKPPTKWQTQAQLFVHGLGTTSMLLSAALGIAHPEQYDISRACLREVSRDIHFADLASQWSAAFTVLTVVSNRSTPCHRDIRSGGRGILDGLLNIGGGPHTVLEFPGMGVRLQYDSRTLVLFSGHVHLHGVSVAREERVCLAFYARKALIHKCSLKLPSCPRMETIMDLSRP